MRLSGPSGAPREAKALFPPDTEQRTLQIFPRRPLPRLPVDRFGNGSRPTSRRSTIPTSGSASRAKAPTRLRWRRDGREIVWLTPQRELMAADVATAPRLAVGEPRLVFTFPASVNPLDFDLSADGKMLVVLVRERRGGAQPASVVLDWAPEADS